MLDGKTQRSSTLRMLPKTYQPNTEPPIIPMKKPNSPKTFAPMKAPRIESNEQTITNMLSGYNSFFLEERTPRTLPVHFLPQQACFLPGLGRKGAIRATKPQSGREGQ